jgi:hypothetical protein
VKGVGRLVGDTVTFKWTQVGGLTAGELTLPQASMKEVAVNAVVVTEIACWFFIGECIGGACTNSSTNSCTVHLRQGEHSGLPGVGWTCPDVLDVVAILNW